MIDTLRQSIKLKNMENKAASRNLKLCSIAAILLTLLLGVQIVNSNMYLKKLFTLKNAVDTSVQIVNISQDKAEQIRD